MTHHEIILTDHSSIVQVKSIFNHLLHGRENPGYC